MEHLINPEVPDKQIPIRKCIGEIKEIFKREPKVEEAIWFALRKKYGVYKLDQPLNKETL